VALRPAGKVDRGSSKDIIGFSYSGVKKNKTRAAGVALRPAGKVDSGLLCARHWGYFKSINPNKLY